MTLEEFFSKIDLQNILRWSVLRGYDSYTDYVKYGDAFISVERSRPMFQQPSNPLLVSPRR